MLIMKGARLAAGIIAISILGGLMYLVIRAKSGTDFLPTCPVATKTNATYIDNGPTAWAAAQRAAGSKNIDLHELVRKIIKATQDSGIPVGQGQLVVPCKPQK